MRKILALLWLVSLSSIAQVKGNKEVITKNFETKDLKVIKVNFYADITVDPSVKEGMTITMDSNLFDKIDTETVDGTLHLDQLEWVQPSQKVIIKIGAPKLKRVEKGTHETLKIENVDLTNLQVMAFVGKVVISGNVQQLNLGIENGTVDASELIAQKVRVNIWGWGKAKVYAEDEIFSKVKNEGRIELVNAPKSLKGDTKRVLAIMEKEESKKVNWISFKIKNNSWNRNNFFVVGPRGDGGKFSYGFPMMPGKVKKERWSVGTKIYKVNKVGLRKLLVKIKPEDEGTTVKLFTDKKS